MQRAKLQELQDGVEALVSNILAASKALLEAGLPPQQCLDALLLAVALVARDCKIDRALFTSAAKGAWKGADHLVRTTPGLASAGAR